MEDRDYKLAEVLETYRKDGSLIREKARVLLEDWFDRIYPRLADPDTPTSTLIDISKILVEVGDMKPKATSTAPQGPGFSITINIPQPDGRPPITVTSIAEGDIQEAEFSTPLQVQPAHQTIQPITHTEEPPTPEDIKELDGLMERLADEAEAKIKAAEVIVDAEPAPVSEPMKIPDFSFLDKAF